MFFSTSNTPALFRRPRSKCNSMGGTPRDAFVSVITPPPCLVLQKSFEHVVCGNKMLFFHSAQLFSIGDPLYWGTSIVKRCSCPTYNNKKRDHQFLSRNNLLRMVYCPEVITAHHFRVVPVLMKQPIRVHSFAGCR